MNTSDIKNYLQLKQINTENLTDTDISSLYNASKDYIIKTTGINPEVTDKRIYDISFTKFKFKNYILDDYPILKLNSIKVDNQELEPEKYYINLESGIIRWKLPIYGETLEINYQKEISKETKELIESTTYELIAATLDKQNNLKSIKEGDITITYDTDNNQNTILNKNIENLKELNNTNPYSKMIR